MYLLNVRPWYFNEDAASELHFCRIRDGKIDEIALMETLNIPDNAECIDCRGGFLLPAFCDSHTHIVYAGSRHGEYIDKIRGLSYEDIAARGGGILNSADALAQCSEKDLFDSALARARRMMATGTGAIEIKSGYGLDTAGELKMLRAAAAVADAVEARTRITLLAAHAVARAFTGRQEEYVDYVVSDMLPAAAAEGIASYIDVFCDRGFFSPEQTERILEAAAAHGMRPKIHACELAPSGGVEVGVRHGAVSVDHLESSSESDIALLSRSRTIATLLPGASFFSRLPYAPARALIDSGATVALASDCNPGSSPASDMRFIMALGCIQMRMLPHEALLAATLNGAKAMELDDVCGSMEHGKDASIIVTRPLPHPACITYSYTDPWIEHVFIRGKLVSA